MADLRAVQQRRPVGRAGVDCHFKRKVRPAVDGDGAQGPGQFLPVDRGIRKGLAVQAGAAGYVGKDRQQRIGQKGVEGHVALVPEADPVPERGARYQYAPFELLLNCQVCAGRADVGLVVDLHVVFGITVAIDVDLYRVRQRGADLYRFIDLQDDIEILAPASGHARRMELHRGIVGVHQIPEALPRLVEAPVHIVHAVGQRVDQGHRAYRDCAVVAPVDIVLERFPGHGVAGLGILVHTHVDDVYRIDDVHCA